MKARALCVDLDGYLLRTDTLLEEILTILRRRPASIFKMLSWLLWSRARLKQQVALHVRVDAATLPYDQTVVKYLHAQKVAGRHIALVLRPKHRDQEVTCGGSRYLIKQRAWSGGSGGRRGFQDCG
jgi:hypothetical protein